MANQPSSNKPHAGEKPPEKPKPLPEKEDQPETFYKYVSSNMRDTLAYVILIVGIVLLFFEPLYGGLLVGIVAGLYFSNEILWLIKSLNELIEEQGMVRSLVLGGLIISFFISAPAIFVGAAIAMAAKKIIFPETEKRM